MQWRYKINRLELKTIKEIRNICLTSLMERVDDKNKNRIEHEMIFIKRDCKEAIELINMLIENDS